jgi:two-component system CAI-1 autoinducer sensor kinase/phosphatase CqsS
MALITAILILLLLIDPINAVLMFIMGTILAFGLYELSTPRPLPIKEYLANLPIFSFALVAGAIFNLTNEREKKAKIAATLALGGHVAHELRTPLLGIRSGAIGAKNYLPKLVKAYTIARESGLDVPSIRLGHLKLLEGVLDRIEGEVNYSFLVIDMVLANAGNHKIEREKYSIFSVCAAASRAIDRYTFKRDEDRKKVQIDNGEDFEVYAVELLFAHILFNLLKNALYALEAAGVGEDGRIRIWAQPGAELNYLHFRDNGTGIPSGALERIFEPFATTKKSGTGLGLHFCRLVMERFGGEIICRSEEGSFTEFVLTFPKV